MKLPTTYKGILKLLIAIAENGNDYNGKLTEDEEMNFGAMVAGIQNDLGENDELLSKFKLKYKA